MQRQKGVHLTMKEVEAVMRQAKAESSRNHCMFLMGYLHGLRAQELADLRLEDITSDGVLHVERRKGSMFTHQPLMKWKGNVLMDEVRALKVWLKDRDSDSTAMFTSSKTGGHLTREQVSRAFHACAERAGLPPEKRYVHILKHSVATHCCEQDMNIMDIKQLLGHSALSSTMVYSHTNDTRAVKAAMTALQSYSRTI